MALGVGLGVALGRRGRRRGGHRRRREDGWKSEMKSKRSCKDRYIFIYGEIIRPACMYM